MRRNLTFATALVAPSAILFVSFWLRMSGDPFPLGNDPGNWLKIGYSILGVNFPMWEQTTFQYPPFFPSLLAAASLVTGNELVAVKLLGAAGISIVPLASYPLARQVSDNRWIAVSAVWLVAFAPIFEEMFGWGGYPDAFGIVFLALAFGFAVMTYNSPTGRNSVLLGAASFLVPLTHHLTFLVMMTAMVLVVLLSIYAGLGRAKLLVPLVSLASGAAGFGVWQVMATKFQYVLYNASSLSIRPLDYDAMLFTFKNLNLLFLLLLLAAAGGFWLVKRKKYFELILLVSLALAPYLVAQSYVVGIALDFRRFPAFSVIPLSILASVSVGWAMEAREKLQVVFSGSTVEGSLPVGRLLVVAAFGILLVGTVGVGVATQSAVFQYYHTQTDYTYQGDYRLQALNWIRANVSSNAVIAADDTFGRWAEGYAHVRVLMDLPPYQAFIVGEVPRAKAADLILSSNVEISNPYVRIRDGTPYYLAGTPTFAYSDGNDYVDALYLTDANVSAALTKPGSNWTASIQNPQSFSMGWTARNNSSAAMGFNFETSSLTVGKTISLNQTSLSALVSYDVSPRNGSTIAGLALPVWVPYGDYASFSVVNSSTFSLTVNGQAALISPMGRLVGASFGIDNSNRQQRLLLDFGPTGNEVRAGVKVTFLGAVKSTWRTTLDAYTSDEMRAKYGVDYIAVGILRFGFKRFAMDPRLTLVFANKQIGIFEFKE